MKRLAQELLQTVYSFDSYPTDYQHALLGSMRLMGDAFSLSYAIRRSDNGEYSLEDWSQPRGDVQYQQKTQQVIDTLFQQNLSEGERALALPSCYCAAREHWGESNSPEALEYYDQNFPPNAVGFVCTTGDGEVFSLLVGQKSSAYPSKQEQHFWNPIAEHIAIAWRLRRRLQALPDAEPAAVFTPEGKLLHSDGAPASSLARLRALVLQRELSLFPHHEDFSLWPELLDGRWTLIDRFTSSGKRYVVALSNQPKMAELLRLTPLEAMVLKGAAHGGSGQSLAITLDISEAHASRLLTQSMKKLGLASLVEAAQLERGHSTATLFSLGESQLAMVGFTDQSLDTIALLTPAEKAVAADLLRGLTYQEIALRRGVSVRTITNQVQSIFGKAHVSSRRELAAKFSL